MATASETIWDVLKKRETTGVLSSRRSTGRQRKTSAVDNRNIVRDWVRIREFTKKYRNKAHKFWDKVSWTDDTISSVKHDGGSDMGQACIASSGTGSLLFINDVTCDGSSELRSLRERFVCQFKKRCNQTGRFIRGKKRKVLVWPSQSPDLIYIYIKSLCNMRRGWRGQ